MGLIGTLCAGIAAAILLVSGVLKLGTSAKFQVSLAQFRIPHWMLRNSWFARVFPFFEIALGAAVLLAPAPWHLLAVAGMLAVYTGFLVVVIRAVRGPADVSCNCFGGLGDEKVGPRTVVRNILLLSVAALGMLGRTSPSDAAADWLGWPGLALPLAVGLCAAAACLGLRASLARRRKAHLLATLTLQDARGGRLPITELQNPPTFLVFFSHGCGPCHQLVPVFRSWPNVLPEGYDLQPVLLGTPEQFAKVEAFAPLIEHAWYDPERAIARAVEYAGTPSVVLISRDRPLGGGKSAFGGHGIRRFLDAESSAPVS